MRSTTTCIMVWRMIAQRRNRQAAFALSPHARGISPIPLFATILVALSLLSPTLSADWPQFRGPNGSGVATGGPPPVDFGPNKNRLWRTPLASGHSSPCIVGDSIFVTVLDQESESLSVICIARRDGTIRWRRDVPTTEIETGHPSFNPASSTPASDGQRVVAYFGSFGLVCFDMHGKELWQRKMPLAKSYAGNAASPIITGDQVILYRGNYVDHYLLAVDKRTGAELWNVPQEEKFTTDMSCTGMPIVADNKLIIHSARSVQAFDLATGNRLWLANCKTTATSTPILVGDEVVVATWNQTGEESLTPTYPDFDELVQQNDKNGDQTITVDEFPKLMVFHRSEGTDAPQNGFPLRFAMVDSDDDKTLSRDEWSVWRKKDNQRRKTYVPHGLIAIDVNSHGTIPPSEIRYLARDGIPEVPSPIHHGEHVYFVKNGGILTTVNHQTGQRISRIRTKGRGTHYASPIIAGDLLFCTAGDGTMTVLQLGPTPKVLAVNKIGERIYATPAIVDGTLYVRTHKSLMAFGL
ncbi:MAG: PQQ-binding-like beta-propeller repeat protein [Pirellulaceae bacterium]|nr:PQQ-binding-like beta-propeller repeat protein [Pirellulaceae bacterium]